MTKDHNYPGLDSVLFLGLVGTGSPTACLSGTNQVLSSCESAEPQKREGEGPHWEEGEKHWITCAADVLLSHGPSRSAHGLCVLSRHEPESVFRSGCDTAHPAAESANRTQAWPLASEVSQVDGLGTPLAAARTSQSIRVLVYKAEMTAGVSEGPHE